MTAAHLHRTCGAPQVQVCRGLGGGTPPAPAPQEGEREGVRGEEEGG
jgi:hypothetical protein